MDRGLLARAALEVIAVMVERLIGRGVAAAVVQVGLALTHQLQQQTQMQETPQAV